MTTDGQLHHQMTASHPAMTRTKTRAMAEAMTRAMTRAKAGASRAMTRATRAMMARKAH